MRPQRHLSALLALCFTPALIAVESGNAVVPSPASAAVEHLTLTDAIQRALASNYTLKAEAFSVTLARAQVTEQLGAFDPKLVGRILSAESEDPALRDPLTDVRPAATVERADTYSLALEGLLPWGMTYALTATSDNPRYSVNQFADRYSSFAGISGRQPLLRDAGVMAATAQVQIAYTNRSISEWQFRQQVIDTVTEVINAYYELNFSLAQARAARRSRDAMARLVEENRKRHAAGSMSEYDVIQARARLAQQEESVLFTEKQVHDSANTLKGLISADRTPALLDWQVSIDAFPPAVVEGSINPAADFPTALRQRPDYQQAAAALRRQDLNYRYQRNQMLPRVDLVGSYGYSGYDTSNQVSQRLVRHQDYRSYTYGVEVIVPLTFAAERGRYRAARSQRQQAETNLQLLEQDILISVGNAANQIESARRRVEATRTARQLQAQTLEAETKRLQAGTGSTFFVLQEQSILANLEVSESRALADYHRAVAAYDRQLGATLSKHNLVLAGAAP